jgi:nucleotide-binding universal stress UspA family protein
MENAMSSLPYQSLLCPVDFSSCSGAALRAAGALAARDHVPLTVLHAIHLEAPPYFTEAAQSALARQLEEARDAARQELERWAQPLLPAGLDVTYEIVDQPPVEAIRLAAQARPGCWIVMGTHGRTGLKRLFLGSVTERTLREAHTPVVTIPPGAPSCE